MMIFDAFLRSWPSAPWLASSLLLTAAVYFRGWRQLHARDPERWHIGRLVMFLSGLVIIFLALASPIEPFASLLLSVHMVQHLLLMVVAPPLVWLGWPMFPVIRGLPRPIRTYWVAPLLRWPVLRSIFRVLSHPVAAWFLFTAMTWLWHLPRGYELALASDRWHVLEHLSFTAAALLFWYPVVLPYPSRPRWPRWLVFPYLLLADVQNTVLAAWLTFSSRVLYPHYAQVPRLNGFSALEDQRLAGVLMWVPGSVAFLVPLFWLGFRYLSFGDGDHRLAATRGTGNELRKSLDVCNPASGVPLDVFNVPLIGRMLRWRYARRTLQLALAMLALVIAYDGFFGVQLAPMNLAGVFPWIHWRGLLILALLVAGNAFCFACPFTLPRSLAGRWLPVGRPWPRWLRNKWLAVVLVILFLWSYEAFSLWDRPWITAWLVVGYFVAAFLVDSVFADGTFCKFVCPIGQFSFVASTVSPLEVAVRQPSVCVSCTTHECIRGSATDHGCGMQLFQPRKVGNMDCTFCLDCVHACPHQNVGVLATFPMRTLWTDPFRSGIGRLSRRWDLAALVLVLVFGAFTNAAGMIEPAARWQAHLQLRFGDSARIAVTMLCYAFAIVALPFLATGMAAAVSRFAGSCRQTLPAIVARYAYALIPIGVAMWLAHASFHLFTSWETAIPATQRLVANLGWDLLGMPSWKCACCESVAPWITQAQILVLNVGLLASLYVGLRITEAGSNNIGQIIKTFAPWAMLILFLFGVGVWILFQPMEIRGTLAAFG